MSGPADPVTLVVDLDGTLCRTDTLFLGIRRLVARPWVLAAGGWAWWRRGRARAKAIIATRARLDPACFPWHDEVVAWMRGEQASGRLVVLATGADRRTARAVAAHLGGFAAVIASDGRINRIAGAKRQALVDLYGHGGFDYAGDSRADLAVWSAARRAIVVGTREPGATVDRRFPARPLAWGFWFRWS